MQEFFTRGGHGLMAFAGIILATTGPIPWQSPQFWAAVTLAVIPVIRNSTDNYIPKVKK